MGGGKRGGAEEEAEGGPEAAAANAARGTRPSSPHASSGGGLGRLRGRPGRTQGRPGRREGPPVVFSVASATAAVVAWLPGASERASEPQVQAHTGPRSGRLTLSSARHSGSEGKREGGGVCASAKTPTAATRSAVTSRARRPAPGPSSRVREAGSSSAGLLVARSRVTGPPVGTRVELEGASPVETAFLFLTRLSALSLPPSDFLAQARFSPSEFSRFVSSSWQTFPFPPYSPSRRPPPPPNPPGG